jgi:hypothetical protein
MEKKPGIQGLCGTCNSRWMCLSQSTGRKRGEPILYCESFDNVAMDKQSERYDERTRRKSAHAFNTPLDFGIKI